MEQCACPLCGQDRPEFYRAGRDRAHGTPGQFRLVRCRNCRLVYLNPRPTEHEIGDLYPPDYGPHQVVRSRLGHIRRIDVGYGMSKRARFVERYVSRRGYALDIGCGTGEFLLELRSRGWQVVGQEISDNAAIAAIEAGLDVRTSALDRCGFEAESFDLVTLWDVIEHLPDPLSALREIRRILRPSGLLVLSTPDIESLDSRLFAGWWHGLEMPRHLVLFGPETIRQALQRAGFQVQLIGNTSAGSYHVRLLSIQALIRDLRVPEPLRRTLLVLAGLPLWRLASWPAFRLLERAGIGPVMTIAARRAQSDLSPRVDTLDHRS